MRKKEPNFCLDCKKILKQRTSKRCVPCHYKTRFGEGNVRWKGGRGIHGHGYVLVKMPNHPNAHKNGYVFEHRLVMENALGRTLKSTEEVHHKNGNRADNRIENLEVCNSHSSHVRTHHKRHVYKPIPKDSYGRWIRPGQILPPRTPHRKATV